MSFDEKRTIKQRISPFVICKQEDDEMSESSMLDSQRMFEHACAFCNCAKFCEVEPNNIEYRMRFLIHLHLLLFVFENFPVALKMYF